MSKFYKVYGTASQQTRRNFLKYTGLAAGAVLAAPSFLRAQNLNSRIRVVAIGVGGKGGSDTDSAGNKEWGGDIVGLCDVDANRLNAKAQRFPNAKKYADFRKMLTEMEKEFDAVTVSTPDHIHGLATVMALKMNKHVYAQKPLVQTVHEARVVRKLVQDNPKLATQMGNQGSAERGLRRAVEVIQAGVIGPVRELHVWSNRPVWPQGLDRPQGEDPVPAHLDWDLWLGPAPKRPYKNGVYHDFKWRGWYEFGTGALGDMACHTVNMPFRALKMGYPTVVECEVASKLYPETFPLTSRIRFEFPQREDMVPLKFWWYDGNPGGNANFPLRPGADLVKEIVDLQGKLPGSGCLLIGDKGKIFSPDDYGSRFYIKLKDEAGYASGDNHEACKAVPQTIPRSPGHDREWFEMMRDPSKKAYANFDISAYLTEIILLGCVALRMGVGTRLDWDGANARAKNVDVSHLTKRDYRPGWALPV